MRGLGDIFEIPELRKRVLFTLGAIAVFRIGAAIPIPGVNGDAIRAIFNAQQSSLLGFLNTFSGGALGRFSIFSMGVVPYINASIIMSLLQGAHVLPFLDRLAKDGELGRRKLNSYTRYLTLFLAVPPWRCWSFRRRSRRARRPYRMSPWRRARYEPRARRRASR